LLQIALGRKRCFRSEFFSIQYEGETPFSFMAFVWKQSITILKPAAGEGLPRILGQLFVHS
jgi:hypothetical protein